MPDILMYVSGEQSRNSSFLRAIRDEARRIVCEQPGVVIEHRNCWARTIESSGTDNITVQWCAHYKDGDGRNEAWEHAITAQLAPALGAIVEEYFPCAVFGVSVDGKRIPFGPQNSYYESGGKRP